MNTYIIIYKSTSDSDCCTVTTEAFNKDEAIHNVNNEYWDIDYIIECYKDE